MTQTAVPTPPAQPTTPATVVVVNPFARLTPLFWILGVLVFEVGTWMGERLRFPGDTAFQIVLILAFLALGVHLRQREEIAPARLALILAGLLFGFSLERWLLDALPFLQAGNAPWAADRYVVRTAHEVLSAVLHTAPAIALLLWTGLRPADFRLAFGHPRRLFDSTSGRVQAGLLALVTAGILVWRLPLLGGDQSAAPLGLAVLAVVYALANAAGAEIVYRSILQTQLEPVIGNRVANGVQAAAYGLGFGLYGGIAGLEGAAVVVAAIVVSFVFGAAGRRMAGIGLLVAIHALATFLFELPRLA
jgi:membrane protease YdiL (CAAX protease family)